MALIKCPECGKEISDKSKHCIHCGYPITQEETTSTSNGCRFFKAILVDYGTEKVKVIKAVREVTGMGLKEAKDFVESLPQTIQSALSFEECNALYEHFSVLGADIEIQPDTESNEKITTFDIATLSPVKAIKKTNNIAKSPMKDTNMTLINCPACGTNVSESAESCPSCGFGVKKHILTQKISMQQKREQEARRNYETKRAKLMDEYAQYSFEPPTMLKSIFFLGLSAVGAVIVFLCILLGFGIIEGDGSNPLGLLIFSTIYTIIVGIFGLGFFGAEKQECSAYKKDPEAYKANHAKRLPLTTEQNRAIEQKLLTEHDQMEYESSLLTMLRQELKELNPSTTVIRTEAKSNIPRCPHCNSTKIRPISTTSRMVSVAAVGLASGKIGKQFECLNCKYKW